MTLQMLLMGPDLFFLTWWRDRYGGLCLLGAQLMLSAGVQYKQLHNVVEYLHKLLPAAEITLMVGMSASMHSHCLL